MSKKMFEAVVQKYEGVKKSIQERWESFKNKFEGSKSELSQDVLKAGTPDELLAVAEKIKNEAEAMKAEQDGIKQEESREDAAYEDERQTEVNRAHEEVFKGHEKYEEASEMNRAFDENKAAEEAALEKARIAAEEKKTAEDDAARREEILAKINGKDTEISALRENVDSTELQEEYVPTGIEDAESKQIDAVALNNKIVAIRGEREKAEALANLSEEEISAVAKNIASSDWEHTLSFLNNFRNKAEIVSSPEMTNKFKEMLSSGRIHLYDVDRIQGLPGISKEIFSDDATKKGIKNSIKSFVSYQNGSEWPHVSDSISRVVEGTGMDTQDLRDIAEEIKANADVFRLFVQQFGAKRLYPEA